MTRLGPRQTKIAFWLIAGLAALYEVAALAFGRDATISQYVWNASTNPFFVFACGLLAGHFFFRKSTCENCGRDPYVFPEKQER